MESRITVLKQIAATTTAALERLERWGEALAAEQRADVRWLVGFAAMIGGLGALLGVMAHGFHRL